MASPQPPTLTPGPTAAGDIETELPPASAEDRKAAAALSALDARGNDDASAKGANVDVEAVRKAMDRLGGGAGVGPAAGKEAGGKEEGKKEGEVKKVVKVEAGDVKVVVSSSFFGYSLALIGSVGERGIIANIPKQIEECELSKPKATELLKANDGDLVKALRAFVSV